MTHMLRNHISVLEGSGGNVAVLTGPDGKVLVDAGIGVSRPQMTKALADLGGDPVTHLINTHWHFDHTDRNAWLNSVGAKIIAQENTLRFLSHVQRVEDWDYNFVSPPPNGLPSEVFSSERSLNLNGQTISLKRYSPAHTDSDISVTFAEADIVHVADTSWNGVYPFIDYSTGGSIDAMIAASDANLAATTDQTIIIPGHGQPVSNRAELQQFRDMLVAIREKSHIEKPRPIQRRDGRRKADGSLRRQVRRLVIDPGFHQVGLRRRVIPAATPRRNHSVRFAMGRLDGKVAVITGANSGIELPLRRSAFAAEGAQSVYNRASPDGAQRRDSRGRAQRARHSRGRREPC